MPSDEDASADEDDHDDDDDDDDTDDEDVRPPPRKSRAVTVADQAVKDKRAARADKGSESGSHPASLKRHGAALPSPMDSKKRKIVADTKNGPEDDDADTASVDQQDAPDDLQSGSAADSASDTDTEKPVISGDGPFRCKLCPQKLLISKSDVAAHLTSKVRYPLWCCWSELARIIGWPIHPRSKGSSFPVLISSLCVVSPHVHQGAQEGLLEP